MSTEAMDDGYNEADKQYLLNDDVVMMPIEMLIPDPNNARIHDDRDLEALCENIKKFKFSKANAIEVDGDGNIICGHGRRLAALRLGMSMVPVQIRDDLTEEEIKLKRISDNVLQDLSLFDNDKYQAQVRELTPLMDLTPFGIELDPLPELEALQENDPVEEEQPVLPQGDNYNILVFCEDQDQFDLVQAFLLKNAIDSKTYE